MVNLKFPLWRLQFKTLCEPGNNVLEETIITQFAHMRSAMPDWYE